MQFDIKITANTENILQQKENNDLTLVNATWDKELNIEIKNPFNISVQSIWISEFLSDED